MTSDSIEISVDGLSKRLGNNQALAGLSTRFSAGRLHGVIGPEGAGKTTLLRSLLGLLRPDAGTVRLLVNGEERPTTVLQGRIAYMPQQQSLYPDLSVGEHLDFFAELYGLPSAVYREKRERLLGITRLTEFQDRPARKLSGGMYKKLGLMCALLQSPAVLLLDEPTNGVDPISRREFWELLYELREGRILIIVATAYMDEAERCSEVHLLNHGRLLLHGEPRTLLETEGAGSFDELFIRREQQEDSE